MNCIICFEKMKAECGGKETNWSQRCITCDDSWICGDCYHNWREHVFKSGWRGTQLVMPCGICKKPMHYSNLVNSFHGGVYQGSWEWEMEYEEKPIWKYLEKMEEEDV